MNKKTIIASSLVGLFLVLSLIVQTPSIAKAVGIPTFFVTVPSVGTATSTVATTNYLTPGTGTTTMTFANPNNELFPYKNIDSTNLYIQFRASTTAAVLTWKYQWSNGLPTTNCATVPTACDWYDEDQIPVYTLGQNIIEHASTTITHRWTPGNTTASTTNKVLAVPFNSANYARVQFFVPAGSANATIFLQENSSRVAE